MRAAPVAERRVLLFRPFKPTSARGVKRKERAPRRRGGNGDEREARPEVSRQPTGARSGHVWPDAPAALRPCAGREPRSAPVAAGACKRPPPHPLVNRERSLQPVPDG